MQTHVALLATVLLTDIGGAVPLRAADDAAVNCG